MMIDDKSIDLEKYYAMLGEMEGEKIDLAMRHFKEVADFADTGERLTGDSLPWSKTHGICRIGEGKLSIWAGTAGSGKSLLLGQVMTALAIEGRKVCIASLEMQPKQTLYRMICQSATCKANRDYCYDWLEHMMMDRTMWIYDQLDSVKPERVLGMCHYAAHEIGCNHIVVDSLTKCGMSRDDYAAQAKFVDKLQWCAKRWGVHIHLVCHMRKSDNPHHKESRSDIRGAAEVVDLADNVFILRRNRVKEKELELAMHGLDHDHEKMDEPDAYLAIEKNRDYGHETTFGLWFNRESGQYTGVRGKYFPVFEPGPANNRLDPELASGLA